MVVRKTRRVRITLVVDRHARAVRSHELQAQVSKLGVLHVRTHAHLRHVRVVRVHLDRLDNALEVLDRRVHSTRVLDHGARAAHKLTRTVTATDAVEARIQDAALSITSVEAVGA